MIGEAASKLDFFERRGNIDERVLVEDAVTHPVSV